MPKGYFPCHYVILPLALQIAEKDKGEKERYPTECRVPENSKEKAFRSEQSKEIEGKTGDLIKKIRDTKGIFHAKMGTIKDRNGITSPSLTKGEDIKKRWQEYTELYKKDINDPDNHDGVITHLKPDILECKVKWTLEASLQTKLVQVIEFQLSYFKS